MSKTKPILHYFDGRGKAEIVRLVFSAAGIEVNSSLNIQSKYISNNINHQISGKIE